jgi:hypothetical protein
MMHGLQYEGREAAAPGEVRALIFELTTGRSGILVSRTWRLKRK